MTPRLVCNVAGSGYDYPVSGQEEAREHLLGHICSPCLGDLTVTDEAGKKRVVAGLTDLLRTDCGAEWTYFEDDGEEIWL